MRYLKLINDNPILIRKFFVTSCQRCSERLLSDVRHVELFSRLTGLNEYKVESALRFKRNLDLQYVDEDELLKRLRPLEERNIKYHGYIELVPLMKLLPVTLSNRIMVLEEIGLLKNKINPTEIKRFFYITRYSTKVLREKNYIEENQNVMENMLNHVDLDEANHPEMVDENISVNEIKFKILQTYLKHKLGMENEKLALTKPHMRRLQYKSLRNLRQNIHLCKSILEMSNEKINSNPFLLYQNTESSYSIINEIKEIGGMSIVDYVRPLPKILSSTFENFTKILDLLKEYEIAIPTNVRSRRLFTLSAETVERRIQELDNHEFLLACRKHPRVFDLIFFQEKLKRRLQLLGEMKLTATLNTLVADNCSFNRYYDHGFDKAPGRDTIFYLSDTLNYSKWQLRPLLNKHPFWSHIPLVHIRKNTEYLKKTFTNEEIFKNIFIILYPLNKIEYELEKLEKRSELNEYKVDGKLRKEMILPLVNYYIEKANNFTCEGVWDFDTETQHLGVDAPKHFEKFTLRTATSINKESIAAAT